MATRTIPLNRTVFRSSAQSVTTRRRPSLLVRLFGCRHRDMGAPVTVANETYRACTKCGARRAWDKDNWRMTGKPYFEMAETRRAR